jgi:hypothetical protein
MAFHGWWLSGKERGDEKGAKETAGGSRESCSNFIMDQISCQSPIWQLSFECSTVETHEVSAVPSLSPGAHTVQCHGVMLSIRETTFQTHSINLFFLSIRMSDTECSETSKRYPSLASSVRTSLGSFVLSTSAFLWHIVIQSPQALPTHMGRV